MIVMGISDQGVPIPGPSLGVSEDIIENGLVILVFADDVFVVIALPQAGWKWLPIVGMDAAEIAPRRQGFKTSHDIAQC